MLRAQYEIKYIGTDAVPRYITSWFTPEGRDRFIASMTKRGWDVIRVTRLFQSGTRAA